MLWFCRFGTGVEKKLEAERFCEGGAWEAGGEGSSRKRVHEESMWELISDDLTGLPQMGQSTAISGVGGGDIVQFWGV